MIGTLFVRSALRKGFDSVVRRDLDALRAVFAEDATMIYPGKGTFTGRPAIVEFYRHFLETFPKVEATVHAAAVENLFDFVGSNVMATCFEVHTTNRAGVTFTQEGMQLIRMRRGKITFLRYFFADTEGLARAWKASESE